MKHTDFYDKLQAIQKREIAELKEAVKAHGGSFSWEDDDLEAPIVAINPDNISPKPMDVEVFLVSLNNDKLRICGTDNENGYEIEFSPEEVFPGHLSNIIDYIPEINGISDVTAKQEFFKITSVSRDDLAASGFDITEIDDYEMRELAEKMADDYCDQFYWGSLSVIAEDLDFPRTWDIWFKQTDLKQKEEITDYCLSDFSAEDAHQEFIDACEDWWNKQTNSERKEIYQIYS